MANQTLGVFAGNGDALAAKDNIERAICSLDGGPMFRAVFFWASRYKAKLAPRERDAS